MKGGLMILGGSPFLTVAATPLVVLRGRLCGRGFAYEITGRSTDRTDATLMQN